MNISLTIIEDDPKDRDELVAKLKQYNYVVSHFFSGIKEIKAFEGEIKSDIIICDYLLENGKTALDVFDLSAISKMQKVLIHTNFHEESVYNSLASRKPYLFVKKGIEALDLHQTIQYLHNSEPKIDRQNKLIQDKFFVKLGDRYKSIDIKDVLYFEVDGKYVIIYCEERSYAIRTTLTELEYRLTKKFVRTHSAFIVNISKIASFKPSEGTVELINGKIIPFTRKYKNNLLDAIILT